jgi:hypothetical protein
MAECVCGMALQHVANIVGVMAGSTRHRKIRFHTLES